MDLSWSELLIVGIVAVIFIGKDLPGMFRELGRFSAKVRAMGREFSRAMEAAAKESGVKDVADDLRKVANPKSMGMNAVKSAADKFEKWDPMKPAAKPAAASLTPPPMPPTPTTAPAITPSGPATSALAEKVAARKAASAEKVAKLREAKAAPATAAAKPAAKPATAKPAAAKPAAANPAAAEAPAPKRGGRVRKKPAAGAGEDA